MQIFVTAHALQRMQERGTDPNSIQDRIALAEPALDALERRTRVALVGQDPPVILDFRPPSNVTVVTVLPHRAGVGGRRLVKLSC